MLSLGLTLVPAAESRAQAGLVGPNAVIQLAAALRAAHDQRTAERVFAGAGLLRLLVSPPDAMIDETFPARLFESLWRELPPGQASSVAHDAGHRTGAYVVANRIPAAARLVLLALPPRLATPLLLRAIRRNAWTFAGSGTCGVAFGSPAVVTITNNPLTMPGCVWHVGVFERLFRALVSPATRVRHTECRSEGAPSSRFEIDTRPGSTRQKGYEA
jgi:divinyl protochlorophyllide a 8-vinyl-reductase